MKLYYSLYTRLSYCSYYSDRSLLSLNLSFPFFSKRPKTEALRCQGAKLGDRPTKIFTARPRSKQGGVGVFWLVSMIKALGRTNLHQWGCYERLFMQAFVADQNGYFFLVIDHIHWHSWWNLGRESSIALPNRQFTANFSKIWTTSSTRRLWLMPRRSKSCFHPFCFCHCWIKFNTCLFTHLLPGATHVMTSFTSGSAKNLRQAVTSAKSFVNERSPTYRRL